MNETYEGDEILILACCIILIILLAVEINNARPSCRDEERHT